MGKKRKNLPKLKVPKVPVPTVDNVRLPHAVPGPPFERLIAVVKQLPGRNSGQRMGRRAVAESAGLWTTARSELGDSGGLSRRLPTALGQPPRGARSMEAMA